MNKPDIRIVARVSPHEKKKIEQISAKCGLPQSEYIRKRALGYSPRMVLPNAFYDFYAKLCEVSNFIDGKVSSETEEKLLNFIDEIRLELLLPDRENLAQIKATLGGGINWQPQASGQLKES